jgi:HAD superfamily hydrolase (TIGR01509 family)
MTAQANESRGVIFDLDGLLVDSEIYWERARSDYCSSEGCDWSHEDELACKGKNSAEWAQIIIQRCSFSAPRPTIIAGVVERMAALYLDGLPLLPGARDLVRELAKHFPLGLASSSPPDLIRAVLSEAGILSCFRVIVSSDEVGVGKPDPRVYLVAASRLGVEPSDVVVFEDSTAGVQSAKAAGMKVIVVPNEHYPPDGSAVKSADRVLNSLEDFDIDEMP